MRRTRAGDAHQKSISMMRAASAAAIRSATCAAVRPFEQDGQTPMP